MDFPDCETAGYRPPVIPRQCMWIRYFLRLLYLCEQRGRRCRGRPVTKLRQNVCAHLPQSLQPDGGSEPHTHSNTGAVTVSLPQPSNPPAQQLKNQTKKSSSDVRSWSFCRRRLEILTLTLTASVFVYTASTNIYISTHTFWDGDYSLKWTDRSKPPYPKQNGCRRNFRLLSCLRSLPTIPRAVQSGKKGGGRGREQGGGVGRELRRGVRSC